MGFNYLLVHAVMTVPVVLVLAYLQPELPEHRLERKKAGFLFLLIFSYVYTIPWDNLMISIGVWEYGSNTGIINIWEAPIGEYMFFGIQTLIAGFWLYRSGFDERSFDGDTNIQTRIGGVIIILSTALIAFWSFLQWESFFYMASIIIWATPVVVLQWSIGGGFIVKRWRQVARAIIPPTLYLSAVDYVAIHMGYWSISEQYTTGVSIGILPIEEVLFFFTATVMVVFGLVLFEWVLDKWKIGIYVSRLRSKYKQFLQNMKGNDVQTE